MNIWPFLKRRDPPAPSGFLGLSASGYRGFISRISGTSGFSGSRISGTSGFSGVSGYSGFRGLSGYRSHKNPLEIFNEILQRYKAAMNFEELEAPIDVAIGDEEKRQLERLGRQLGFSMVVGEGHAEYGSRMFDFLCEVVKSDTPVEIEHPKSRYDIIRDEA